MPKNIVILTLIERNEGTFSKYASLDDQFDGFHFYLAFIKFGIGRQPLIVPSKLEIKKLIEKKV